MAKMNPYIKSLLIGGNIWYLGEGMLGPLLAVFTERIGGDVLEITWAWATYLIIAGLLYIVFGYITDVYQNKALIMVLGYYLNALFTFCYLFVATPFHLFLVQAGLGLAAAMATPTWDALYSRHQDKGDDGFEWGFAGGSAQIITAFSIVLGGYIVTLFSFTVLFLVMGCMQLVAAIYQSRILALDRVGRFARFLGVFGRIRRM